MLFAPESFFLTDLFNGLNSHELKYCVLRNYEDLPHSLTGSDLDLLLSNKSIGLFYGILHDVLEKHNGYIISQYGVNCRKLCLLGFSNKIWWGAEVDLFIETLPYKTVDFISPNFVLNSSKKNLNGITTSIS